MRITLDIIQKELPETSEEDKNPWNVHNIQCYNPLYTNFATLTENNYKSSCLNLKYFIANPNQIYSTQFPDEKITTPLFVKSAPLIDPIHFLIGKYKDEQHKKTALPQLHSTTDTCMDKILNKHNASYVDCFFNYLSSETLHKMNNINGIDFYGSYLAVQKKFCFNAYDDIEYLQDSSFFLENNNKLYELDDVSTPQQGSGNGHSQQKRPKLNIQDETIVLEDSIDICDNEEETPTSENNDLEVVFDETQIDHDDSSDSDDNSEICYSSEDDDTREDKSDEEDDSDDDDEDEDYDSENSDTSEEEFLPLYIYDFPVQMIALEKCDGTLDQQLESEELEEKEVASALIQVIFTLMLYQDTFEFTHNDLHTNNILYKKTNVTHLYYEHNKQLYKVPTFGRIYKIIDFGRAIFTYNGQRYCSDSFAPKGDAHGQYNTEPYFNGDKPRIEPNYSFDLCRLGCSMYDFVLDSDEPLPKKMTPLQKLVHSWCLDDNGMNVLYKKNGEERYPNFKLYKMISRLVHKTRPHDQLKNPFFSQFICKGRKPKNINIIGKPL